MKKPTDFNAFQPATTPIDPLTEVLREGAKKMLQAAINEEVEDYLSQFTNRRDAEGKRLVVRNGLAPKRSIQMHLGRWYPLQHSARRAAPMHPSGHGSDCGRQEGELRSPGRKSSSIGDGALGFWKALPQAWPKTRIQRCWVHKAANVLNKLPKSAQPKAKDALHQIWMAETKSGAAKAFDLFIETYAAKYPKASSCLAKDRDALLAFYDFPA